MRLAPLVARATLRTDFLDRPVGAKKAAMKPAISTTSRGVRSAPAWRRQAHPGVGVRAGGTTAPCQSSRLSRRCGRDRSARWLLRKPLGLADACDERSRGSSIWARGGRPPRASQAVAGAIWCLNSFNRLCVAVISRHSERHADLPRRWKRSIRRLNFVSAKTGSIIPWRFR